MSEIATRTLLHLEGSNICYCPASGAFTRSDGSKAGCIGLNGYLYISVKGKRFLGHRLAWFLVTGAMPEGCLDHINNTKTDNRFENLRRASKSQNGFNRGPNKNNSSGAKGVHWYARKNKWKAEIWHEGSKRHLGYFHSLDMAAKAYSDAAKILHGEFARVENEK